MTELTKEYFDEVVKNLATKDDVQKSTDEILFRLMDAMATIEEDLGPEERLAHIDQKFDRLEKILHVEL